MYIIEYMSKPADGPRTSHIELALGSTAEEAADQANMHLPKMASKYGALCYRILDRNKDCVGIGPQGFLSSN